MVEVSCPTLATPTSPIRCSITSNSLSPNNNLAQITSACSVDYLNLALTPNHSNKSNQTSTNKLTLVNSNSNSKHHQLKPTIIWLTLTRWISSSNSRDKEHGTLPNSRSLTMCGRRAADFLIYLILSKVINLVLRSIILHKLTIITVWTYFLEVTILISFGLNPTTSLVAASETNKTKVVSFPWLA